MYMYTLCFIVIIGLPSIIRSFQLPSRLIFDELNTLENIVNSKAVVSTITSRMNMEIINENILFQQALSGGHLRLNFDLFYLSILAISWYSRYMVDVDNTDSKLANIQTYSHTRKITNTVLFVVLIILSKNVENAI